MKPTKVWAVYFSGTGTTEKTVRRIAETVAQALSVPCETLSFTVPHQRGSALAFTADDLVIFGTPVYAGRVPNVLLPFLTEMVSGNGALAVPVVLYGNRNYDDALVELRDILRADGFVPVAAAAFVGEHSFSRVLAAGRPDSEDMLLMEGFAEAVARKVLRLDAIPKDVLAVGGEEPIRPYYKPRDREGNFICVPRCVLWVLSTQATPRRSAASASSAAPASRAVPRARNTTMTRAISTTSTSWRRCMPAAEKWKCSYNAKKPPDRVAFGFGSLETHNPRLCRGYENLIDGKEMPPIVE